MKYWHYKDEIHKGIKLNINETYVIFHESNETYCIFRAMDKYPIEYDDLFEGFGITNMNFNWSNTHKEFNFGDINTYPWCITRLCSLDQRSWRLANANEVEILNKSFEISRSLTKYEHRDLKLDLLLSK